MYMRGKTNLTEGIVMIFKCDLYSKNLLTIGLYTVIL